MLSYRCKANVKLEIEKYKNTFFYDHWLQYLEYQTQFLLPQQTCKKYIRQRKRAQRYPGRTGQTKQTSGEEG